MEVMMRKGRKTKYRMNGGPLHDMVFYLESAGTLPFSMHGQYGYYNEKCKWISL